MESYTKLWGKRPFWGADFSLDPQWCLTEEQKDLQKKLIELCRTTLRPNAVESDELYKFPHKNLDALGDLGLLSILIPKEFGGLGWNHVGAAMVIETVARYGCPSTAMVLVMHTAAVGALLLRYHNNPTIQDVLRKVTTEKLVGSLMYSDPATGGHFWYALSSKSEQLLDSHFKVLKVGSWCTSAGFADFYVMQTISPGFDGDYSNMSCFLIYKSEVRANSDDWQALGMRGNQSGPITFEGTLTPDRLVGPIGDGATSNDEIVDPFFLSLSGACWCGIAMAMIDLAKRHVTSKYHADVGMHVRDYPTIQDYFGDCIAKTNAARAMVFQLCNGMDIETNNSDWTIHADVSVTKRANYLHWCWQVKYVAAKTLGEVGEVMLHACGGSGFKTDLGLERLLRDSKAAWVMGPSNEVLRQWAGRFLLFGYEALDYWSQKVNSRQVQVETKKMTTSEKRALAEQLLQEVRVEESDYSGENDYQNTEFDNPFNTHPVRPMAEVGQHAPGLQNDSFCQVKVNEWKYVADKVAEFSFALPNHTDHLGCLPGQYIQLRVQTNGKKNVRYFSPTSAPDKYGVVELITRFESQGEVSKLMKTLKPGDLVEMRGPCGGYEYIPNTMENITLITSGVGCTPSLQLVRSIMADPKDKVKVTVLHSAMKPEDVFFKEEFDSYAAKDKRLNITYTVVDGDDKWEGEEGYIDMKMLQASLPAAGSAAKHKFLICGGPGMVVTVLLYLKDLGYTSDQMYVYGQFGVLMVQRVYGQKTRLCTHKSDYAIE